MLGDKLQVFGCEEELKLLKLLEPRVCECRLYMLPERVEPRWLQRIVKLLRIGLLMLCLIVALHLSSSGIELYVCCTGWQVEESRHRIGVVECWKEHLICSEGVLLLHDNVIFSQRVEELREEKVDLNLRKSNQLSKGEVRDPMNWLMGVMNSSCPLIPPLCSNGVYVKRTPQIANQELPSFSLESFSSHCQI